MPIATPPKKNEAAVEPETRPLWTVEEVANYLRYSPEKVRQMARLHKIPAIKMERGWRFVSSEVKDWVHAKENSLQSGVAPTTIK